MSKINIQEGLSKENSERILPLIQSQEFMKRDSDQQHQASQNSLESLKRFPVDKQSDTSSLHWKQTLKSISKYKQDEKIAYQRNLLQMKNASLGQKGILQSLQDYQIEDYLTQTSTDKYHKVKPYRLRYDNPNSIPTQPNKTQLDDTLRGPGHYQPSYSLTQKHNPQFNFEGTNKRKSSQFNKIDHENEVQQRKNMSSFLQSIFIPDEKKWVLSPTPQVDSSRNSKINQTQWSVFKSNQPQLQPLDQWKCGLPGPGYYQTQSKDFQSDQYRKLQKIRQFDKYSEKTDMFQHSLESPFSPVTNNYSPPVGYYFSDKSAKKLENQAYKRRIKTKGFLSLSQQLGSSRIDNHSQEKKGIDIILEQREESTCNSILEVKKKNKHRDQSKDKGKSDLNKSNDSSIGPGSYEVSQEFSKKSISSPFKSRIDRFQQITSTTAKVDSDMLKYSNFNAIPGQQSESPSFRSQSKRTIVFDLPNTKDQEKYILPEYFTISHKPQGKFLSQKELRFKMQQSIAPFNSMSPRFKLKPDFKGDLKAQLEQQINSAVAIRGLSTDRENLKQSQPEDLSKGQQ